MYSFWWYGALLVLSSIKCDSHAPIYRSDFIAIPPTLLLLLPPTPLMHILAGPVSVFWFAADATGKRNTESRAATTRDGSGGHEV